MSPIDQNILNRKISRVIANLGELEKIMKGGWEKYRKDIILRKATEKMIQEVIESICDVNDQILIGSDKGISPDYRTSFLKLGEHAFIPLELAEKLAPSAGLRNRLVHEYEEIDDRKVFSALGNLLKLVPMYLEAIRAKFPPKKGKQT